MNSLLALRAKSRSWLARFFVVGAMGIAVAWASPAGAEAPPPSALDANRDATVEASGTIAQAMRIAVDPETGAFVAEPDPVAASGSAVGGARATTTAASAESSIPGGGTMVDSGRQFLHLMQATSTVDGGREVGCHAPSAAGRP